MSERLDKLGKAVSGGKDIKEAMREAGYGERFVNDANAASMAGLLEKTGRLTKSKAESAAAKAAKGGK